MRAPTTLAFRIALALVVMLATADALMPRPTSLEDFERALGQMRCHTLIPVFRSGRPVGFKVGADGLPEDVVRRGDVIMAINGAWPLDGRSFAAAFAGDKATLTIMRDGEPFDVVLRRSRSGMITRWPNHP